MPVFRYFPDPSDMHLSQPFLLSCMGLCESGMTEEMAQVISDAKCEIAKTVRPSVCYLSQPLQVEGQTVWVGEKEAFSSASLSRLLAGRSEGILFAATLGAMTDRAIAARAIRSPLLALAMNAAANAWIEAVCDAFCHEMQQTYGELTARFSPGYGDLALGEQRRLLSMLDASKTIGLSLTEGSMMVPLKSVTALMGIRGK